MLYIIWEFAAAAGREMDFERAYGDQGVWTRLFSQAPGYVGTVLLRDSSLPGRYVTVDKWESRAEFDAFKAANAEAYARIDAECESLTGTERFLGSFDVVRPMGP